MAMGKRKARQESLFITTDKLALGGGHPFYRKLNGLLAEAEFDRWVEDRCRPHYAQEEKRGQPSIPPGIYFRMLLVGYFEGIDSQRGIAWPTLTGARPIASACGSFSASRSTRPRPITRR